MRRDTHRTFIGREDEISRIAALQRGEDPAILIVYGRRRVGKTALLEKALGKAKCLCFEGIQGLSEKQEIEHCLQQLAKQTGDHKAAKLRVENWAEFFDCLADYAAETRSVIYFEEMQWLANYREAFASQLKPVWDARLQHNPGQLMILCGSSPSFMISKIIRSQALYGRSQHIINLRPFSLTEAAEFLGTRYASNEVLDGYLSIGGIPEYLKYLKSHSSVYLSICENAFLPESFFSEEQDRVFVSSLAKNPHFRKTLELLAKRRFATRPELAKALNLQTGGGLTELLMDLELCGFIEGYAPYMLDDEKSRLRRFRIADSYLGFYERFVRPLRQRIRQGEFQSNSVRALNRHAFRQWLGLEFEKFCVRRSTVIAKILGFSGVEYKSGAFFNRGGPAAAQIDLVFDRKDRVLTVCEIKYQEEPVKKAVVKAFAEKLETLPLKRKSLQKVLIAPNGCEAGVRDYFDQVIDFDGMQNW